MRIFLVVFFALTLLSCKKDSGVPDDTPDPKANTIQVFKNTTGNPASNSLQAQIINTQYKFTLNLYGTFDANNNPLQVHTVVFKRANNDTTAFLTFDVTTNKLQTVFTEVAGVRQPIVLKHEYIPGNDTSLILSVYNYNWSNNTSQLKFQTLLTVNSQNPRFLNQRTMEEILFGLKVGVGVAGIVYTVANAAAIGTAIAAALPAIAVAAAATGVIILATDLLSHANASELEPMNQPLPIGTPVNNPTNGTQNPTPNLPQSPCNGVLITFSASRDSQGNALIFGATGGVGPYMYAVGNLNFQSSQVFPNPGQGSKAVFVMDSRGCIGAMVTDFTDIADQVSIGTQIWKRRNLDVATYRNGDPIPQVTDITQWGTLTTGAWCYYNNDPANGDIYGKLYNWYAVNDPRGLAPQGWHVPTYEECLTLRDLFGGEFIAGKELKSTNLWQPFPNITATNSSGFTGLPTGERIGTPPDIQLGVYGYLWTTKSNPPYNATYFFFGHSVNTFGYAQITKYVGMPVRVLKN
jgi:uncharacterized protein (TIGR02145 family)